MNTSAITNQTHDTTTTTARTKRIGFLRRSMAAALPAQDSTATIGLATASQAEPVERFRWARYCSPDRDGHWHCG